MTGSGDSVIRIRGLHTRFGSTVIHEGLDLDVRPGEVFAVVGGSGSGKSVLLNTLIGLNRPAAGTIEILGEDAATLDTVALHRLQARCGVLFQQSALFSSLTVMQNVQLPLKEFTDLPPKMTEEIAALKIAMAGLPPDSCGKYPAALSGGMRKRAGLARALAMDPEILFLDEPTAGLDPIGAAEFDSLIGGLQRSLGLTVLMVTHDVDTLYAICDRIGVLVDRKMTVGTLDQLLDNPHPWIQAYFRGPRARGAAAAGKAG
ncbi:MAG: ATP-binding cassette domain-containing protein [Alphaproteobacteria bacterium]|nr:ATP-binding cassette domain-containing protein [Alphaproteobacteria bacterium]